RKLKLPTAVSVSNLLVTPSRTTASIGEPVLPRNSSFDYWSRHCRPGCRGTACRTHSSFDARPNLAGTASRTPTPDVRCAAKRNYVCSIKMHGGAITKSSSSQNMLYEVISWE